MEYTGIYILTFVIVCLIGENTVNSLKCHKCSSILNTDCGAVMELDEDNKDKYLVECPSTSTACQKIVGEIQGNFDQHVYRKCWEGTNTQQYTPTGCEDDGIRGGVVCRCTTDACNGQRHLTATLSVLILAILCHTF